MRKTIADAVERRNKVLEVCAAEKLSDRQMREVAETATRNGFRTQAEEDEANDVAIAQALAELAQEKEARLGQANAPPLPERPEGYGGGSAVPGRPGGGEFASVIGDGRWRNAGGRGELLDVRDVHPAQPSSVSLLRFLRR